jgi:hypothetical protein
MLKITKFPIFSHNLIYIFTLFTGITHVTLCAKLFKGLERVWKQQKFNSRFMVKLNVFSLSLSIPSMPPSISYDIVKCWGRFSFFSGAITMVFWIYIQNKLAITSNIFKEIDFMHAKTRIMCEYLHTFVSSLTHTHSFMLYWVRMKRFFYFFNSTMIADDR